MTTTMKLGDLFEGCTLGELQSVGIMQIIPLLNEHTDEDKFAQPGEAIVSTRDYGNVQVRNPTARLMIVPLNAAYMKKQGAQDHAITTANVMARATASRPSTIEVKNSLCVESTQDGLMPEDAYRLSILPASLRSDIARAGRQRVAYNSLWGNIEAFNTEMTGSHSRGHLRDFFDRFDNELDEFIAQFEPVPHQVGAVVLIAGEIIGIERAPSQHYWLGVWEALIRDCYGSRAMQAAKRLEKVEIPETRARIEGPTTSLVELEDALSDVEAREAAGVSALVEGLKQADLKVDRPYSANIHGGLIVSCVNNDRITGQVIHEGGAVVYASTVAAGR